MPKPIVVIYWPENEGSNADKVMSILNGWDDNESAGDYWKEYYWFCFPKRNICEPEFQVFHEKDFTDIQFEELKKMVTEAIK